jgi:BolA family transcriptional regulator, general stress-responsive regulator
MTAEVAALIGTRLTAELQPTRLEVRDDSHLHAGHAGAREGGHYHVIIAAAAFRGLAPLARHRRIYDALGDLLPGRIHALSIEALLPDNPAP